jgi:hypothetical protein
VPDQLGAGRDSALGDLGRDCVGVFHGDTGPGLRQLHRLFALLLGGDEDIGGFAAIGVRHHGGQPPWSLMAGLVPAITV